jgi:anti-sigma B factor antagonist
MSGLSEISGANMNTAATDYLEGAMQDAVVWVRLVGRGSFKLGPTLKTFAATAVGRGGRRLIVEMSDCTAMDSTLMGVLAGLALQLKPLCGAVTLLHLSAKNREALTTLGLGIVLDMPPAAPDSVTMPALQRLELTPDIANTATGILAAHESLIAAAPENQPHFSDLVTQLKEEIQRSR